MRVAGTGCRGWLPGGGPHRVGEVTNQDKNRAVRGHARATPPPIQLSSNPEIFFVFLGNLYGIPGNPMGRRGKTREPIRGVRVDMGFTPAGCNASVQSNFAFVNNFLYFLVDMAGN